MKEKGSKAKAWIFGIIWVICFALVNYPIGAWAGQKLTPVILGMPFSVFYFWSAYSLLIIAGLLLAWQVFKD